MDDLIFMGYQFSWFLWRVQSTSSSIHEIAIFCMKYENIMVMNSEPHERVILFQSTTIGTLKIKLSTLSPISIAGYKTNKTRIVTLKPLVVSILSIFAHACAAMHDFS